MRKTDKKIDNAIRQALTDVCDFALEQIAGYQWITHQVNYDAFPDSLQITCAFISQSSIDELKQTQQDKVLKKAITEQLARLNIKLKQVDKQIILAVV